MKISIIGPVAPYRGGIAHFTTLLAKKLVEAGHEVQVISFKKQYPAWLYPGESDKDYSPGRETVEAVYLLTPLNPVSWWKTIRAVVAFQPEQVILPWWVTFWGPAVRHIITRLKRHGMAVTVLIHNTMPHEARFFDRQLAKQALQGGDRFIVMTQKEKERLLSILPDIDNILLATLPIYHSFKKTRKKKIDIRKQLGLPGDKPIILFFGFIRPYKGLGVLINALKILVDQEFQTHLLVVGEFWEDKNKYLSQIQTLGLKNCVHIFDSYIPDDEVAAFFMASDVFVAPYIDGTQSAALKTALGFGLPVVATDVVSDEMINSLHRQCKIVPTSDSSALADGIKEQLCEPILNNKSIENLVNHSWEAMLAAICDKLNL
jgi:glycosyltransferase involved in cell wall biosynthesis